MNGIASAIPQPDLIERLANGFELDSASAELNDVFFGGGAGGIVPTVWLILVASAYGGLTSRTGMLTTAIAPVLRWARTPSRLVLASALRRPGSISRWRIRTFPSSWVPRLTATG